MEKMITYYRTGKTETLLRDPEQTKRSYELMGFEWKGSRMVLGDVSVEFVREPLFSHDTNGIQIF